MFEFIELKNKPIVPFDFDRYEFNCKRCNNQYKIEFYENGNGYENRELTKEIAFYSFLTSILLLFSYIISGSILYELSNEWLSKYNVFSQILFKGIFFTQSVITIIYLFLVLKRCNIDCFLNLCNSGLEILMFISIIFRIVSIFFIVGIYIDIIGNVIKRFRLSKRVFVDVVII